MENQLKRYLYENIPLTEAMRLEVLVASPERVLLSCPLAPNINHRGTAFGGSIASLATLAGWGWIWVMMKERQVGPRIVVSRSEIDYVSPVEGDFTAELRPPSDSEILAFLNSYDRRNSARIELKVDVLCDGDEVAHFKGQFVVIKS
jgi:thioesterase domain-containing protein